MIGARSEEKRTAGLEIAVAAAATAATGGDQEMEQEGRRREKKEDEEEAVRGLPRLGLFPRVSPHAFNPRPASAYTCA